MTSVEYYQQQFSKDLIDLMNSHEFAKERISIVSLVDNMSAPDHYGVVRNEFKNIQNKPLFLMSYFFLVLMNQAIHSGARNLHQDFQNIVQYPKLVGILSSYGSNLHPALLLIVSIKHSENIETTIDNFRILTKFLLHDYQDFFYQQFPKYSKALHTNDDIKFNLKNVFNEIDIAIKWSNVPKSIWNYQLKSDEFTGYKSMIEIFNNELTKTIQQDLI